ncbi:GNAT family N-acetyltransferase [Actinoallomurus spadix]|uniref:BioF2-like acetyltransferase domain-containing protein n=1 Tax=Actinoallomurus spadix TaxID=79912 RepID=A0ABN0XKF2_9ACTN|nr:GNAT family N-acetyltransferase [Actinoallomurus spadix]MCO5985023.1 GNAT family N-acetyltransferase [Actinoallomurus spadix]
MRFDIVRPDELGEPELARWRALQGTGPVPGNPFLAPEFTLAVGRFRADARVTVLSDGTGIVGFFPYERHGLGLGRPIGAGLTDCQGLVGPPDLEFDVRALLRACRLSVWEFDHLLADQAVFAPFHAETRVEPVMDLRAGFAAYAEEARKRSPKTLKTVRYKERKLGREAGEVTYTFDERDPAELRRLMAWKSAQYRRTGRTDRFAVPWIVALVEHLHATGAGVLSVLRAGGRPVSAHLGLRAGPVMAGWFPAYDIEFGRYSPGMIGHLRMAEAAAGAGVGWIAMGRGGREYKDWLRNAEFGIAEGRVARVSAAAGLHWVRAAPVRRARSAVLAHPALYAGADRVLRTYARLRAKGRAAVPVAPGPVAPGSLASGPLASGSVAPGSLAGGSVAGGSVAGGSVAPGQKTAGHAPDGKGNAA